MSHPRVFRVLTLPLALLLLLGCESGQKTSSGGLDLAVQDYQSQAYEQSRERATGAMRTSRGADRERAAYIAGLSAFELGMIDEAERRFMTASRSADPEVQSKSKAMLGQIRLNQGRYQDAARFLNEAAGGLASEDARQARQLADQARQMSSGDSSAGVFRIETAQAVAVTDSGFALQVGAFRERSRANRAADEARQTVEGNGLGPVKVIPSTDDRGRRLYLVRVGHFETRRAAADARQRIGRLDFIVATWNRSTTGG